LVSNTLLHVVIPVYKQEEYFKILLDSLIQNLGPYALSEKIRVSIIDDATPGDSIYKIVKAYPDYSLDYHRNEENLGLTENFKKCVEIAQGKFFWMPGADDVIDVQNVAEFLEYLEKDSSAMVVCGASLIDFQGNKYMTIQDTVKKLVSPVVLGKKPAKLKSRKVLERIMVGNFIYFPAVIWRTDLIKKNQFRSGYGTCLDLDLIARMLFKVPSIAYWPGMYILQYRRHPASDSSISSKLDSRFNLELRVSSEVASEALVRRWWLLYILSRLAITARIHRFLVKNSFIQLRS
jgi:glycosyltransferase involved in cell wall biosynthesis